jgi:hypothetical protein
MDIATFESLIEKLEELYLGSLAEHVLETEHEYYDFDEIKQQLISNHDE